MTFHGIRVDGANMDALIAYRPVLRDRHKVNVAGPYPGDEAGWEWLSIPHWGWHVHRRPADGGGALWLAYDTVESSVGEVGPHRGRLVATCHTTADGVPGEWQEQP